MAAGALQQARINEGGSQLLHESPLRLVLTWYLPWIFLPTQTGTPIKRAGIDMPARKKDQWKWKAEVNQRILQALMIVNCVSITSITYKCDANRSSNKSSQLPQQLLFSRPRLLSPESTTWAKVVLNFNFPIKQAYLMGIGNAGLISPSCTANRTLNHKLNKRILRQTKSKIPN